MSVFVTQTLTETEDVQETDKQTNPRRDNEMMIEERLTLGRSLTPRSIREANGHTSWRPWLFPDSDESRITDKVNVISCLKVTRGWGSWCNDSSIDWRKRRLAAGDFSFHDEFLSREERREREERETEKKTQWRKTKGKVRKERNKKKKRTVRTWKNDDKKGWGNDRREFKRK